MRKRTSTDTCLNTANNTPERSKRRAMTDEEMASVHGGYVPYTWKPVGDTFLNW